MPRKTSAKRSTQGASDTLERSSKPRPSRSRAQSDDLVQLSLRACLVARDAAFNVRDLLINRSRMAFLAIKDCEKELDLIERQIDERLPVAITRVGEARARQLLASLKNTTDLERIGDLVMSAARRM